MYVPFSKFQVINDVNVPDTGHYVFRVEVKGGNGVVLKKDVDLFLKVLIVAILFVLGFEFYYVLAYDSFVQMRN
jgi:hypothetical protein